jgi:hypothetical protein
MNRGKSKKMIKTVDNENFQKYNAFLKREIRPKMSINQTNIIVIIEATGILLSSLLLNLLVVKLKLPGLSRI